MHVCFFAAFVYTADGQKRCPVIADANTDETKQRDSALAASDFVRFRCFQQRSEESKQLGYTIRCVQMC